MKKIFLSFFVIILITLTWCTPQKEEIKEEVIIENISEAVSKEENIEEEISDKKITELVENLLEEDNSSNEESENIQTNNEQENNKQENVETWTWNTDEVEFSENKYCILDTCIDPKAEIKEEWDYYVAEYVVWEDEETETYTYKLSKEFDYFELNISKFMYKEDVKIFKLWDNYVKYSDARGCWGSNLKQFVYDKNWDEIKDFLLPTHNSPIKIWNITYNPTLVWNWWFWQPLDSYNDFKIYKNEKWGYKIYKNDKDFVDFITNKVLNEDKKLYPSYIANYSDYPSIYIMYEAVWYDDSSLRVVWLWKDENYLEKNIKEEWSYFDLAITNKIIWYYDINWWTGFFDKDGNRITGVTKDELPVFKMKKLNENWNYLVYPADWQKLQSFAEMCKPVVYYYSKDKEENRLNLNLKKWDYFTKLIPELDKNNWWDFSSKNWNIKVKDKNYDYLYYSLVTLWYKHNKDWWIVSWKNIVSFFEDKLEKINFTQKEKTDFIDYWKSEFENDKYYFVSFKYKEDLDKIIKLDFTKKVDNEFRVLLDSYEIEDFNGEYYKNFLYENIWDKFDKFLIKRFERGNTENEVFEWWGVLQKKDETVVY